MVKSQLPIDLLMLEYLTHAKPWYEARFSRVSEIVHLLRLATKCSLTQGQLGGRPLLDYRRSGGALETHLGLYGK